jgi:hypothetical protein
MIMRDAVADFPGFCEDLNEHVRGVPAFDSLRFAVSK